jgi:Asp-tRNA(Asn)/Glu-tRNA(Gln) amidotransferase C subunit
MVLLVVLSLVECFSGPARAQEPAQMLQQGLGPQFMVFRDKVQKRLKVSDDQKKKLQERLEGFIKEMTEVFQSLDGVKPEEREKKIGPYRQKAHEKLAAFLKETLKEEQLKQLRQLVLQQEGLYALGHPEVAAELKFTDEQKKQFTSVLQELQKKIEPLIQEAQSGGNPEEIRPKVMKLHKQYEGKIDGILSDAQKKHWKEMLGEPFELGD